MKRFFSPLLSSDPVFAATKASWLFTFFFALTDFLFVANALVLCGAYWLNRSFTPAALLTMSGIAVASQALSMCYSPNRAVRLPFLLGRIVLGNVLASLIYLAVRSRLSGVVSPTTFAEILALFTPLQIGLHVVRHYGCRRAATALVEPLRWMLIAMILLALHRSILTNGSIGAGDSYWYCVMVADFLTQLREGVFPIFVGQSEFAFNGAVSPLRLAPCLQYLAGVVDCVTLRSLPFYGILNFSLLTCYVAGAFTCYGCLRAIEPRTPWLALVLSLLYSTCPALFGLAYMGDLYMSVTALPFVPLLVYGIWRTLAKGDRASVLALVAPAAALWYCHAPIALWGTVAAAVAQLVRLPLHGLKRQTWLDWLIGAGVFLGLTLAIFTSVLTLHLGGNPANRDVLIENVLNAYPLAIHPLSDALNELGDYQLGWSLWFALLVGFAGILWSRPRLPSLGLGAAASLLLIFILPFPWVKSLWSSIPQVMVDLTYMWPMQRFYVLLAGLSVFLAYIAQGAIGMNQKLKGALMLFLFSAGLAWSVKEVGKFHQITARTTTAPAQAAIGLLPQNQILTRYAFNPFKDIPPYFSHGVIDPVLLNRFLDPTTFTELDSNRARIENDPDLGPISAEGTWTTDRPDLLAPTLRLNPSLHLKPGRRYALNISFDHPDFVGALVIRGQRLLRVYWLPNSGYDVKTVGSSQAFGALAGQTHSITLWTDLGVPEEINLQFFFTGPAPQKEVQTFGHYTLREYNPAKLPIIIEKWAPYHAHIKSPSAAYLETPRQFLDGYQARVNGTPVKVKRSPSALVMIPVPKGESRVELAYPGPIRLRIAYFVSFAAWTYLLYGWLRSKTHRRPAQSRAY